MKYFLVVAFETVSALLFLLPRFRFFNWIKATFLKLTAGARIGRRPVFYPGVFISTGKNLVVGDDVDFALGVMVTTKGGVTIGDRTLIGYGTKILSTNHVIPDGRDPIFGAGHETRPVTIGRDVWIGCNCSIMPGVTIGEGAVVAAGAVVTRDVEPFTVVGGVPAKKIRDRV